MATVYLDLPIKAPISRIYTCITDPGELEKWWPQRCAGTPSLGAAYNFFFGDPYDWWGEVSALQKDDHFYIKMTASDDDWDPTTFGWKLVEESDVVWLQFEHRDWPKANRHFRYSTHCWAMLHTGLKRYIEEGIVIPFENRS